jgi:hypothetical protein
MTPPTKAALEAAFCWEADDQIPSRPAMTAFRRAARYHQARWREANRLPIGTQPIAPKPGDSRVRQVGSRLPLEYARDTGANFVSSAALDAARARTANVEPRQSLDHQRLWSDLLSSLALSFNLFGDLAADLTRADRALHRWFPVHPTGNADVVDACNRYRGMLADDATFATMALEALLDSGALAPSTSAARRDRYLPG